MDESLRSQGPVSDRADASWTLDDLRRASEAIKRFVLAHQAEAACTCLLLLMSLNLLAAISRKSITNDEVVHIPAGYYHLVAGDFQLNNEHPPLVKMWAALPLLFIQPDEPQMPDEGSANFAEKTWGFHQLFWNANQKRFLTLGFWPRVMMVPITLTLGVVIFLFARRLFSPRAAVLAVALFSFEPTLLAHGRIVHTDVPSTLTYLLFFFLLFLYWEKVTWRRAVLLGIATALALLTKFSMVVLAPVLLAFAVARFWLVRTKTIDRRRLLMHGGVVTLLVLLAINSAYYFQDQNLSTSDQQWLQQNSGSSAAVIRSGINAASHVVPTYFLFGLYNVALHNRTGHATSLLGNYGEAGWWYYFPMAFALKTSLPFLLVSAAALLWSLFEILLRGRIQLLWILIPLAIFLALSLTSHINIGIRHLLPAFPFLFILGGAFLDRLLNVHLRLAGAALVVLLVGWMVVEAGRTFPDYTPYMNQLASGAPHWWYLSDSNVEWGDDVGALANYLKAQGETSVRAALSGGWSTLPHYGIEFISIAPPSANPRDTRYTAIGASYLNGSTVPFFENIPMTDQQRVNYFDQYRHREPEAVFGGSIYLYRER